MAGSRISETALPTIQVATLISTCDNRRWRCEDNEKWQIQDQHRFDPNAIGLFGLGTKKGYMCTF